MTPIANAWSAFKELHPGTFVGATMGSGPNADRYLENRLHEAFMSGLAAGAQIQREAVEARIREVIFTQTEAS